MAKCVKHFCFRLSGRRVPEGEAPLCSEHAAPDNAEAVRAATRALRQVRSLQRQYQQLLPTLRTALASSCVSEARLLHVRTGLVDLEDLLEGSVTANSASGGNAVCEVVTCIAAEGEQPWCPRRMLLS
ncbi:U2SURP, partial [Symbiodinium necroappetens]